MKFKIHWTVDNFEDDIIIEGEDIQEIKEKADCETNKRGLDQIKNHLWSEELK